MWKNSKTPCGFAAWMDGRTLLALRSVAPAAAGRLQAACPPLANLSYGGQIVNSVFVT